MGQILSTDDVIWFNANAWRRLSSNYLNRIRANEEGVSLPSDYDDGTSMMFQEYQGRGTGTRFGTNSPLSSSNGSPRRAVEHRRQLAMEGSNERKLYSSKTNLQMGSHPGEMMTVGYDRYNEKISTINLQAGRGPGGSSNSDQADTTNLRQGVMLKNMNNNNKAAEDSPRVMGRRKERQQAYANGASPGVQRHFLNKSERGVASPSSQRRAGTSTSLNSNEWSSSDDESNDGRVWYQGSGPPTTNSGRLNSNEVGKQRSTMNGSGDGEHRMPPAFEIRSKHPLPSGGYTSSSASSNQPKSTRQVAQGITIPNNERQGYSSRNFSAAEERRRRKLGGSAGAGSKSNNLVAFKWALGLIAVINVGSSIWAGIYMQLAYNWIERSLPIQGKLYDLTDAQLDMWRGLILAGIALTDLVQLWLLFALYFDHYWLVWIYTAGMFAYGGFGALSEMSRGSYVAWIVPLVSGVLSTVVAHKMAVKLRLHAVMPKYYIEHEGFGELA